MTSPVPRAAPGPSSPSTATKLNAAGMVTAIVGMIVQIAAGVDYPTVPPGPIILAVAVALVLFSGKPWAVFVGVGVPLFLLVGFTIAPTGRENLGDPGDLGPFFGTLVQLVGVVVALTAGVQAYRGQRR